MIEENGGDPPQLLLLEYLPFVVAVILLKRVMMKIVIRDNFTRWEQGHILSFDLPL